MQKVPGVGGLFFYSAGALPLNFHPAAMRPCGVVVDGPIRSTSPMKAVAKR